MLNDVIINIYYFWNSIFYSFVQGFDSVFFGKSSESFNIFDLFSCYFKKVIKNVH